jgi:hypothetical protein
MLRIPGKKLVLAFSFHESTDMTKQLDGFRFKGFEARWLLQEFTWANVSEALRWAKLEGFREVAVLTPLDKVGSFNRFKEKASISGFHYYPIVERFFEAEPQIQLPSDKAPAPSQSTPRNKAVNIPKKGAVAIIGVLNANLMAKGLDVPLGEIIAARDAAFISQHLPNFVNNNLWNTQVYSRVFLLPAVSATDRPLSVDIRKEILVGGAIPGLYGENGHTQKLRGLTDEHLSSAKGVQFSQAIKEVQKELRAAGVILLVPPYLKSSEYGSQLADLASSDQNITMLDLPSAEIDNPTNSKTVVSLGIALGEGGDLSKTEVGEFTAEDDKGNVMEITDGDAIALGIVRMLIDIKRGKLDIQSDSGGASARASSSMGSYLKNLAEAIPDDIKAVWNAFKDDVGGLISAGMEVAKMAKAVSGQASKKNIDDMSDEEKAQYEEEKKKKSEELIQHFQKLGLDPFKIKRQPQFQEFKSFFDLRD